MNERQRAIVEELILYAVIAVVGVIPVAIVLMRGGVFGSEPTIGLIMFVLALAGVVATWRIARKRNPSH
jgi:hypothetical protein